MTILAIALERLEPYVHQFATWVRW